MSAFHAYDIRAIYGEGIDEVLAYRAGRAFGDHMGAKRVLGGHDARTHSASLYRAFSAGVRSTGAQVAGVGLVSTPCLHYLQLTRGYDAGFMTTASHNPPRYHGFKLYDGVGGSVSYAKGLSAIEAAVAADDTPLPEDLPEPQLDSGSRDEALDDYVRFACTPLLDADQALSSVRGTKVVIDASNGSAGELVRRACALLDLDAEFLNAEPDGSFPAHVPNPLEEASQRAVCEGIREHGAELGCILDGDGDRVIFVDDRAEVVSSSFAGALIARELLNESAGGAIVYDLISSRVFAEEIEQAGGVPVKSKVGYTHLYDQMAAHDALYGNEASGHVYFRVDDTLTTESSIFALAVLMRLLRRSGASLGELVAPLRQRYIQRGEHNVTLREDQPVAEVLERVRTTFADAEQEELDGISVSYDRFWFNVRPSNTEPLLRLRLEAVDEASAAEGTERVLAAIEGK